MRITVCIQCLSRPRTFFTNCVKLMSGEVLKTASRNSQPFQSYVRQKHRGMGAFEPPTTFSPQRPSQLMTFSSLSGDLEPTIMQGTNVISHVGTFIISKSVETHGQRALTYAESLFRPDMASRNGSLVKVPLGQGHAIFMGCVK